MLYIIVGNSKCGKTSIIERYANEKFTGEYNITIGADYTRKVREAWMMHGYIDKLCKKQICLD